MSTFTRRLAVLRSLQNRPFALLWLGQTCSSLGDGAFTIALAWEVLLLTGSATAMGLVVMAEMLPRLIFLLLGGVAADRLPRQRILLFSDAGRGVIVLLIALLGWLHLLQLWHLVALALLFGLAAGFFHPAYRSMTPQLVERDQLASANALTAFSRDISTLLGPALGAGIVALVGPMGAFAFDGLSFVFSAVCLLAMRPPVVAPKTEASEATQEKDAHPLKNIVKDLHEGWRFVVSSPWFLVGLPIAALGNIFFSGPLEVTLPRLVQTVYNANIWLFGILGMALALGSILASLIVGQLRNIPKRGTVMYLAVGLASCAELLLGLATPPAYAPFLAILASALIGFGLGTFGIIWVTLMQELVPEEMLGRVSSIDQLGAWSLLPLGYALTGLATDSFGPGLVFLIAGLGNILLTLIALAVPAIRRMG
ncbi:MFS transporter [Ktedonobacter racemifer]|uniref:Major facilitator superfamily MFS_1 n=1 Tax=Ktedonobacter racemifer DSM 44963 TaxID=485913 RepID=D6TTY2_KTERA|nr:MFS transporter [Ktedonobacter racemifer]EFH83883.1 major facilitator superfamily MFS_1 [Ktedonobacter racemifer DSM 44963]